MEMLDMKTYRWTAVSESTVTFLKVSDEIPVTVMYGSVPTKLKYSETFSIVTWVLSDMVRLPFISISLEEISTEFPEFIVYEEE